METLRQKLGDAEGDIKALRMNNNRVSVEQQDTQLAPSMHQREEMIEQLEKLNLKVSIRRHLYCSLTAYIGLHLGRILYQFAKQL